MMRNVIYRPMVLGAAVAMLSLVVCLALLVGKSWRSLAALDPLQNHVAFIGNLEQVDANLQVLLTESLDGQLQDQSSLGADLRTQIADLLAAGKPLVPATPEHLRHADAALMGMAVDSRAALLQALAQFREVRDQEIAAHQALLGELESDSRLELGASLALVVAVPIVLTLTLNRLHRRIWVPLGNLSTFMKMVSQRDYSVLPTTGVDELLVPLFESYNAMVSRLAELEYEHRTRQQNLEDEVRRITSVLFEQQRKLSHTERLAAVVDMAANVAHELRNPLAGIHMALVNLGQDTIDADQKARLELVVAELRRVSRLLNNMLNDVSGVPDPVKDLRVARVVTDVLTLFRYQIPVAIKLNEEIPEELRWPLPESGLRQIILNLLLNAAQSIGEGPGTITIAARTEADAIIVNVSDDGPGFPDELLQQGIRRFSTHKVRGTGIGLSLVQRFVRDLSGQLELSNLRPRGASVSLRLPRRGIYDDRCIVTN